MATLFFSLAFAILLTSSTAHDTTARTIEVKHDGHNRHQPQVQPHLHTAVESAGSFDLMQQSSGKERNLCRGPLDLIDSGCEEQTSQESCINHDQADSEQHPDQPVAMCIWATPEPCQFQFLSDDTNEEADPVICHSGTCEHSHHFCTSSALITGQSCQPQCQDGYHASGEAHCSSAGSCSVGGTGGNGCKVVCTEHVDADGATVAASNSCTLHAPLNGMLGEHCSVGYLVAGQSCEPTCNAGYHVSGAFSCSSGELTVATCVMNDDNTDNASCELQAPDNGSLDSAGGSHCSNELLHGSSCTPKCADGFHPLGLTKCNHGVLTHTSHGTTSDGAAECAAMAAENSGTCMVQVPLHGSLNGCEPHSASGFPSLPAGGSCQIGCDVGYQVVGSTHCDSSGSGHLTHTASCAPSYSSHAGCTVPEVTNGQNPGGHYCDSHLPAGQTCYPRCAPGFHPSGWTSCSSSGDGTLAAATCEPNEPTKGACAVYAPHHGSLGNCGAHWTNVMAPGDTCQVQCDSGYHAVGSTICSSVGDSAEGQLHQAATCQHRSGYHGDIAQVCHVPGTPSRKDGSCDGSLTVGASCSPDSLSCNAAQGYESSTTCMASGRASAPTCVKGSSLASMAEKKLMRSHIH